MTDRIPHGLPFDKISPEYCPVCNCRMDEGEIRGWPVYQCNNPSCEETPTYLRYENPEKISFDDSSIHVTLCGMGGEKTSTYRVYYCPYCDLPMKIIDYAFMICNCCNCHELGHGAILRYFSADTGLELTEEREIYAFLDEESLDYPLSEKLSIIDTWPGVRI